MLILSSPSGAGKTTLTQRLLKGFPDFQFSVSHTTRKARSTEEDGREYHFVDRTAFDQMVKDDAFLEHAEVHGNCYGTSRSEVERAKQNPQAGGILFDIDYQGALQIRAKVPDVVGVFILPPSMAELERRLRGRASESDEAVRLRFAASKKEIVAALHEKELFDYFVVNDDLDRASDELRAIVIAERARRIRRAPLAQSLLEDGKITS
jgi:guanylate kinase